MPPHGGSKRKTSSTAESSQAKVSRGISLSDEAFNIPEFSDFRVKCQDKTFHVSRLLLANASQVFKSMLQTASFAESQNGEMTIEEADNESVEAMLRYIYNGKQIETFTLARRVIELAERYQIAPLKKECEDVLLNNMNYENIQDLINLAYDLHLERLLEMCFMTGAAQCYTHLPDRVHEPILEIIYRHTDMVNVSKITSCLRNSTDKPALCIARVNEYVTVYPRVLFANPSTQHGKIKFEIHLKPNAPLDDRSIRLVMDWFKVDESGNTKLVSTAILPINTTPRPILPPPLPADHPLLNPVDPPNLENPAGVPRVDVAEAAVNVNEDLARLQRPFHQVNQN